MISTDVNTNSYLDNDIPTPAVNTGGLDDNDNDSPTESNGLPINEQEGKGDLQPEPTSEDEGTNGTITENIDTNAMTTEDNDGDGLCLMKSTSAPTVTPACL